MMLIRLGVLLLSVVTAACSDTVTETEVDSTPSVVAQGELISLQTATVGPPNVRRMWQFKIQRLAPENSIVKKGDVIAVFDGQRLRTELISRQSQLDEQVKKAESEKLADAATEQELVLALAEAEMNFEKAQRKVEITDASLSTIEKRKQQADYEINKARLGSAEQRLEYHRKTIVLNQEVALARIKMRQSRVNQIEQDMAKLRVKAPKDGLIVYIESGNGDKPAVGETIYMGQPIIEIPSLTSMALKAEFSEPDTSKVMIDQIVKVTFEAYPEKSFQGTVTNLGQSYRPKSTTNQKVVFDAIISLDALSDELIRPGMKAKVEVVSS